MQAHFLFKPMQNLYTNPVIFLMPSLLFPSAKHLSICYENKLSTNDHALLCTKRTNTQAHAHSLTHSHTQTHAQTQPQAHTHTHRGDSLPNTHRQTQTHTRTHTNRGDSLPSKHEMVASMPSCPFPPCLSPQSKHKGSALVIQATRRP